MRLSYFSFTYQTFILMVFMVSLFIKFFRSKLTFRHCLSKPPLGLKPSRRLLRFRVTDAGHHGHALVPDEILNCDQVIPSGSEQTYELPRIIHFIWLAKPKKQSNSSIPRRYLWNIGTFCRFNPNYRIKIWIESFTRREEIHEYFKIIGCPNVVTELVRDEDIINKRVWKADKSVGARADVLRYEVVFREGGIYTDTDSVAVKPFPQRFRTAFVTHVWFPYYNVQAGVFGMPKGSQFLNYTINCLAVHFFNTDPFYAISNGLTGPNFFSKCFKKFNDSKIQMINQAHTVREPGDSMRIQKPSEILGDETY